MMWAWAQYLDYALLGAASDKLTRCESASLPQKI